MSSAVLGTTPNLTVLKLKKMRTCSGPLNLEPKIKNVDNSNYMLYQIRTGHFQKILSTFKKYLMLEFSIEMVSFINLCNLFSDLLRYNLM